MGLVDRARAGRVLDAYCELLRVRLPALAGLSCHGADGDLVVASLPPSAAPPGGAGTPGGRSIEGGFAVTWLALPEAAGAAGTVGVWFPAEAALDTGALDAAMAPVMSLIARELRLRLQLVDSRRRLEVQATEERLLHAVESLVHQPGDCRELLARILTQCRIGLGAETVRLLLPELGIELGEGQRVTAAEVHQLYANEAASPLATVARRPLPAGADPDRHVLPVRRAGQQLVGVLVLAGFSGAAFSERRRARVARYVVSHIESLLDRDHDRLTGLPSSDLFAERVEAALRDPDVGRYVALYLDLDQMHVANELLGQGVGDEILVAFAGILRTVLPGHAIARLNGDHFAALLTDVPVQTARGLATAVATRFQELTWRQGTQVHRASVSIGVAPLAGDATGSTAALMPAQVACQAAKDRGRGRVEVYEAADQSIVRRLDDIQLVGYLRNAIDRGRLLLLAQPIVATRPPARRPYFEVLVRLLDDAGRAVAPGEFLSAAERYQLMEGLDRWVLAEALRIAAPLRNRHDDTAPRLAINLSGHSLGSETFLAFAENQIRQSGIAPDLLCFEITESVAVANMQRAQTLMHNLKRLGCHFSLDDFGTGLSSFAYLKLFPVDTLKIDGSFIRDLTRNEVSQSVVAAIAEVARVMRLETVAEFVQDAATVALLADIGITWAQGYHVGEPAPLAKQLGLHAPDPGATSMERRTAAR